MAAEQKDEPPTVPRTVSDDARMRFIQAQDKVKIVVNACGHQSMMSLKGAMERPYKDTEIFDATKTEWTTGADFIGSPRSGVGYCTMAGKIYMCGGWSNQMFDAVEDGFYTYDAKADKWEDIGKIPQKLYRPSLATWGDKLILSGGRNKGKDDAINKVWLFDGGKWSAMPDMKSNRASHMTVVVGDRLVVAGGWSNQKKQTILKTTEYFDLKANTWSAGPDMNTVRSGGGITALEDPMTGAQSVFVVGGRDDHRALDSCEQLNLNRNKWRTQPRMNYPRAFCFAGDVNGCLTVFGGDSVLTGGHTRETVEFYDDETWKWHLLPPSKKKRAAGVYGVIDG